MRVRVTQIDGKLPADAAKAPATITLRDDQFKTRRLCTAWDNLGDGDARIRPYPIIFGEREHTLPLGGCNKQIERRTLAKFQRGAIRKPYTFIPFQQYDVKAKGHGITPINPICSPELHNDRNAITASSRRARSNTRARRIAALSGWDGRGPA